MSRSFHALSRPLVTSVCALGLLISAPPVEAGRDDAELFAVVPASAAVVVSTDHATLSKQHNFVR